MAVAFEMTFTTAARFAPGDAATKEKSPSPRQPVIATDEQNACVVSPSAYRRSKTFDAPGAMLPRLKERDTPPPNGVNAIVAADAAVAPMFCTTTVAEREMPSMFFGAYAP